MSVQITSTRSGRKFPTLTAGDMNAVGRAAIVQMKGRIAQALNVNDAPAKPLSPGYAKQKAQMGGSPIRNMTLTGETLSGLKVLEADSDHVVIGFADARAEKRAQRDQAIDPMVGISPRDQPAVFREVARQYQTRG